MNIKHVVGKKKNEGETLYVKDAILVYPSILEPKNKHESEKIKDPKEKRHYEVTVLVSEEDKEALLDIIVNKQFFQVGVTKSKVRKIKFPVKNEDGEETAFTPYQGMWGFSATLNEYNKKGNKNELIVVDEDGEPVTELVGNGSKGHIKFWGYRSETEQLNIQMKLIQVIDHVVYEGSSGDIVDDELGITVKRQPKKESVVDEFEDDDIPDFGDEEDY